MKNVITRANLLFEADIDVSGRPFMHEGITIGRLHVTASASAEPGFWWAEGVGHDADGHPVSVHALMANELPDYVLQLVESAYRQARELTPARITSVA